MFRGQFLLFEDELLQLEAMGGEEPATPMEFIQMQVIG